jgi:hypothetical protein
MLFVAATAALQKELLLYIKPSVCVKAVNKSGLGWLLLAFPV